MNDSRYRVVSFRRPSDSADAEVIDYLRSKRSKLREDYSETITSTLKKHWLPLALFSSGLRGEELREIGIWAISQLEAQISVIRRTCGIAPDPLVVTSNISMQASNIVASDSLSVLGVTSGDGQISSTDEEDEDYDDEDDDDNEFLDSQNYQEMTDIKRMFGWDKP
ncbi:hypothetical protein H6G94_32150 [Nostoc punctiforme FACHB-252]|uniref:Uncharacterized protein n=1 Tax=Nostoc punctiforme FACHB-252 TaxID=1357509 RepID=A0ABR8HJ56_NOSPU|nr:hypothetical protein [Nostoc punctiforme]MBD2615849.1 hypothetical protein [Nostoc punctiforme FACHB-252]